MSKLTNTQIKNARGEAKLYSLSDGLGLSIQINPNGSKWWRFRFQFEGKAKIMSLGTYPDTSLAKAREKLALTRAKVAEGINPIVTKKTVKEKVITFRTVATDYLIKRTDAISEHHLKRSESLLRLYAFPVLGDMGIGDIGEDEVKQPLIALDDANKKESAKKLYGVLKQVFTYAKGRSLCKVNPVIQFEIKDIVQDHVKRNFSTMTDNKDIKNLLVNIDEYTGSIYVKKALVFMSLTLLRSANIRHSEWEWIDFENAVMIIPKEKMKLEKKKLITSEDFKTPLSTQAIELLKAIKQYSGHGKYIFPSNRGDRPLSENAMLGCIRNIGYTKEQFTPHGFRSMFSTIANEKSDFGFELIETQLSHVVGSTVSQSYNRTDYIEKRRVLVQWWGDYLYGL